MANMKTQILETARLIASRTLSVSRSELETLIASALDQVFREGLRRGQKQQLPAVKSTRMNRQDLLCIMAAILEAGGNHPVGAGSSRRAREICKGVEDGEAGSRDDGGGP